MLTLNRFETSRFEPPNPAKRPIALPSHTDGLGTAPSTLLNKHLIFLLSAFLNALHI